MPTSSSQQELQYKKVITPPQACIRGKMNWITEKVQEYREHEE